MFSKFKGKNHNYMAIPRYERLLKGAGVYESSTLDNVQSWYGFEWLEGTEIGEVIFEDHTEDYTGVTKPAGDRTLGNVKSIQILSGNVAVSVHGE
jgi:hypothetical protein